MGGLIALSLLVSAHALAAECTNQGGTIPCAASPKGTADGGMKRVTLAPMKRVTLSPLKRVPLHSMNRVPARKNIGSNISQDAATRGAKWDPNGQGLNQAQINAIEKQRELMVNSTGGDMAYRHP